MLQDRIDTLVLTLPLKLQPAAKAVTPIVIAVIATLGSWALSGTLDTTEIVVAVTGLLTGLGVYNVRNIAPVRPAEIEELQ